jgi:predicted site-specific integrase-resolvase
MAENRWVTVQEFAEILEVDSQTLLRWISANDGKIPQPIRFQAVFSLAAFRN